MKFQLPHEPTDSTLNPMYWLDYLQRLYRHIRGDTDWIAPSLQNGWVDFGGTWAVAGYRLKNGVVYIKGLIKSGTTTGGTTLFTLPVGYRPLSDIMVSNMSNGAIGRFDIASSGVVSINTGSNVYFPIQCSFIAEQ